MDATRDDVRILLQGLLIEVIAANYRYFLHERMTYELGKNYGEPEHRLPPLLANEIQVSGIFSHALSSLCPVSRPEMRVRRFRNSGELGAGHADFFATYGKRSVAIELKRIRPSTASQRDWAMVKKKWDEVGGQAASALNYLVQEKFPNPVSIGLLIVRMSRAASVGEDLNGARAKVLTEALAMQNDMQKTLDPDFLAMYEPPAEMQISRGWGEGGTGLKIIPRVAFAATVHLKQ